MPPAADPAGAAAAPAADPHRMRLPRAAATALPRPDLRLELHLIAFSHYCARAKWYLGACGLGVERVHPLLPVQHIPHMVALLRMFRAPAAAPTASSRSPAATPALAGYDAKTGAPLFLLQDSELIGRWAALRAQAFLGDGGAAARALYGEGATLSVEEEEVEDKGQGGEGAEAAGEGAGGGGGGENGGEPRRRRNAVPVAVLSYGAGGGDKGGQAGGGGPTPAELERRLSGVLGVESRRVIYYHLLPRIDLLARMFSLNAAAAPPASSSSGLWARYVAAPLWACAASLALPKLLNVNKGAVDRGTRLLDAEFAYLDALIEARGCLVPPAKNGAGGGGGEDEEERIGAFLFGGPGNGGKGAPSAADVSLATLAGIVSGDVVGYGAPIPSLAELPTGLQRVVRELFLDRPTARYARALWREHGAAAVAASTAAAGARARL